MHFRIRKHFAYLVIGLLALAGASVCLVGWGGPTTPLSDASGNLDISALQDSFRNPPEDSKIMVRWWWFGPAVTTEELDRELHQMKDAGIGGFEVQPVYPLTLDDPSKGLINLRYLSPEFLAAVSSTARTAHELGLRMDMTMGSGWPFGGPHITPELAAEGLRCLRIPIQHGRPDDPGSAVADRPAIPCGVCGFGRREALRREFRPSNQPAGGWKLSASRISRCSSGRAVLCGGIDGAASKARGGGGGRKRS